MGGACSTYGREDVHTGFWWVNLREKDHLKNLGGDGRIILNVMSKKWDKGYGLDLYGSGWAQVAGSCECGNEPPSSIKCGEFLDYLRIC
jgi:hypothetical protein